MRQTKRRKKRIQQRSFVAVGVLFLIALLFRPWEYIEREESAGVSKTSQPSEEHLEHRDYGELDPNMEEVVFKAQDLAGVPFESGGTSPTEGFNSSGFVQYVYQETTGIRMPRLAAHQYDLGGEDIAATDLRPGDLVFFDANTVMSGIYIGDGEFMTASESNGVETLSLQGDNFWSNHFTGGKRITEEQSESLHPDTYSDHEHPVVQHAIQYLDVPYVFGGNNLQGFDCSFLIQQIFRESYQVYLPRVTIDQYKIGEDIERDNIKPGDVLFFSGIDIEGEDRGNGEITHAGIYLGNNFMIHASRTEEMTQISYINDYWEDAFTGVKRYDELVLEEDYPVVQEAASHLTTSFKSGGSSPEEGFNTSGLVRYVYQESLGVELPPTANAQWNNGTEIERSELQPGDLLFFEGSSSYLPAIYIGNDQFIIASESSGVTTRHLDNDPFFSEIYAGARRY